MVLCVCDARSLSSGGEGGPGLPTPRYSPNFSSIIQSASLPYTSRKSYVTRRRGGTCLACLKETRFTYHSIDMHVFYTVKFHHGTGIVIIWASNLSPFRGKLDIVRSDIAGVDNLVLKQVSIPKIRIAITYRKVPIPELGIKLRYQKVWIPGRGIEIGYRYPN